MNIKAVLVLFIISIVLIAADYYHFLNPVKGVFETAFLPIQIGFNRFSKRVGLELTTINDLGKLRDKNRDLEYNLAITTAENAKLKLLEKENQTLREQLNSKIKPQLLTGASTIGFSTIGSTKFLMIDKGLNDGITKDQLVILRDILIGRITVVTPKSANALLTTNSEFKLPALTSKGARGLAIGQYQKEIRLTKILPEDKVEVGDAVFSSGEAGFPKGLVLGEIDKVVRNDKDIFQEAIVKPLIDAEKLDIVFLLR